VLTKRHTGIVQILTGEVEIADLIGPHPLSRVQAFGLTRPTQFSGHQNGTWNRELFPLSVGSVLQMLGEGPDRRGRLSLARPPLPLAWRSLRLARAGGGT
jgi:hypothetical protein